MNSAEYGDTGVSEGWVVNQLTIGSTYLLLPDLHLGFHNNILKILNCPPMFLYNFKIDLIVNSVFYIS